MLKAKCHSCEGWRKQEKHNPTSPPHASLSHALSILPAYVFDSHPATAVYRHTPRVVCEPVWTQAQCGVPHHFTSRLSPSFLPFHTATVHSYVQPMLSPASSFPPPSLLPTLVWRGARAKRA
mmetsp:Transcript_1067/g.2264  ORF Transcript_1067/g.2264 Transcript_1067/m.2264 type:complete len:122 (-) Transcript_1067:54-419(-)